MEAQLWDVESKGKNDNFTDLSKACFKINIITGVMQLRVDV